MPKSTQRGAKVGLKLGQRRSKVGPQLAQSQAKAGQSQSKAMPKSNQGQGYHTDNAFNTPPEFVALFCLRPAMEGGVSGLVSMD